MYTLKGSPNFPATTFGFGQFVPAATSCVQRNCWVNNYPSVGKQPLPGKWSFCSLVLCCHCWSFTATARTVYSGGCQRNREPKEGQGKSISSMIPCSCDQNCFMYKGINILLSLFEMLCLGLPLPLSWLNHKWCPTLVPRPVITPASSSSLF